jgi:pimeloyl-ACP methyl ester carboxylesterase
VTDYEGYVNGGTQTYTVGQSAGHATLDIVRAATELPGAAAAGITTANPVGIWGYSEGGQAAAWAAQEYATYTPHMHVIGVAAGGVPADLKVTATSLNGGLGSAFLFDEVIGFHAAYPSLPYASLINSAGESAFATITSADKCVFQELAGYAFQNISTYTNGSETLPQLLAIPQWSAALDANQLGNTPFAAPLFTYHAFLDEIVPTSAEEQRATDYCCLGRSVDETAYYLADHLTADIEAVPDVIFFQARVAGTAPVSTC